MFHIYKTPKSLEAKYQRHLEREKVRSVKVMCVLGLVLYLCFLIADFWALPSALTEAFIIRGVVITGFVLAYASTYLKKFIKYYDFIQPAPYLAAALGIELMIFISSPTDKAHDLYFAGLILVIMVLYSWSYMKMINLVANTLIIIGAYAAIEIAHHQTDPSSLLPTLIPNILFLISAAIIGLVTLLVRNNFLRRNFMLKQSLQEALNKKEKEVETQEYLANHDQLTGLPNRRHSKNKFNLLLNQAKQQNKAMALIFLDLNGLKTVNDRYGHTAGDEILKEIAVRLRTTVRYGDCIARLGGDEFGIGLSVDKHELIIAEQVKVSIINAILRPIKFENFSIRISTNIGMSSYPASGESLAILMDIADKTMIKVSNKTRERTEEIDAVESIKFSV